MPDSRTLFCITYPRHGLHFLKENLPIRSDRFNTVFQHNFKSNDNSSALENDIVLTVIRNPIEAIASQIVSGLEINESGEGITNILWATEITKKQIPEYIQSYVDLYDELNKHKNLMVVDFRAFERNPSYAFNYIIRSLGSAEEVNDFIMPKSDKDFIATSKKNQFYEYCYNEVKNHKDIDTAFKSYSLLAKRLYQTIDLN